MMNASYPIQTNPAAYGELDLIAFLQNRLPIRPEDSAAVDSFCSAARRYLAEFRPLSVFVVNDGIGIVLSDGTRMAISPPVAILQGSMAPVAGHPVPISPAAPPDIYTQGAIPITGVSPPPPGLTDYSKMKGGFEDKTQPRPAEVLNRPQQYNRPL